MLNHIHSSASLMTHAKCDSLLLCVIVMLCVMAVPMIMGLITCKANPVNIPADERWCK